MIKFLQRVLIVWITFFVATFPLKMLARSMLGYNTDITVSQEAIDTLIFSLIYAVIGIHIESFIEVIMKRKSKKSRSKG